MTFGWFLPTLSQIFGDKPLSDAEVAWKARAWYLGNYGRAAIGLFALGTGFRALQTWQSASGCRWRDIPGQPPAG